MNTTWIHLANQHPPTPAEAAAAADLLAAYRARGCVRQTPRDLLALPDGVIFAFYAALARETGDPRPRAADSGWMADADFCFVNVRATGLGETPGHFVQAAKLLPGIRANAIHLGPFTDYDFHTIYAVRSVQTIDHRVVTPALRVSPETQLRAFVEAAHLLGKAVGFDLEPHVAQFAIPVIMRPSLFRWLKLEDNRGTLAWGLSNEEMLEAIHQERITREIHTLVTNTLRAEGLDDLEAAPDDDLETRAHKRAVYFALIGALIERGYWTIPSQSWNADGVPAFDGYHTAHNYARFAYRDRGGADASTSAFHILTPFQFYTGLQTNRRSLAPFPYEPAIAYFCDIFTHWRDAYGFDFVRHDSADHIFDSAVGDEPTADRASPAVLRRCIEQTRRPDHAHIGHLAERMGNEIGPYAGLGFDLILGDDMLQAADHRLVEKSLRLYDELAAFNAERARRFAVTFAVDTHDTGNPGLWGEPLVRVAGPVGMRLRHFLARFSHAGRGRRPKYEVMGSQDLSYGLYESNIRDVNLMWVGDADYNRGYHHLEDVYEQYRPLLAAGEIVHRVIAPEAAWWVIAAPGRWLVPLAVFAEQPPLRLDLSAVIGGQTPLRVTAHTIAGCDEHAFDTPTPVLETAPLHAGDVVLFAVATAV